MDVHTLSETDRRLAADLIRRLLTDTAGTSPSVAAWLNRLAADLTPVTEEEFARLLAEALT